MTAVQETTEQVHHQGDLTYGSEEEAALDIPLPPRQN